MSGKHCLFEESDFHRLACWLWKLPFLAWQIVRSGRIREGGFTLFLKLSDVSGIEFKDGFAQQREIPNASKVLQQFSILTISITEHFKASGHEFVDIFTKEG